jgi:deoxyribose-phosphate aldolase
VNASPHVFVSVVDPELRYGWVRETIARATNDGLAGVRVAPVYVARAHAERSGSSLRLSAVIGFPHGTSKATIKAIEATSCVKDGADEVDVVAHLPNLVEGNLDAARAEFTEVVRAVRAARRDAVVKVIVEAACLVQSPDADRLVEIACRAIRESGCDFISTATGHHSAGGTTADVVKLVRRHAQGILLEAVGNVVGMDFAQTLLDAGADRVVVDALRVAGK